MNTQGITHLTFDCYGTLVDWETGILDWVAAATVDSVHSRFEPEAVLRKFVRNEAEIEKGPFLPYRAVLAENMRRIGNDLGLDLTAEACSRFAMSIGKWPPFADTCAALQRLSSSFKLVILSNVDDDLFAMTARNLGVDFSAVITAQQVGSYKPALGHFHAAARLGLDPVNWLHVAQSLYHDHVPAKAMGIRSVWVDRPTRLVGTGFAPETGAQYDARTTTLSAVADLLCA